MSDDIVAELDRWLGNDPEPGMFLLMQRARDEIVALRGEAVVPVAKLTPIFEAIISGIKVAIVAGLQAARAEALENAARVVEDHFNPETCEECAAAIRALKAGS